MRTNSEMMLQGKSFLFETFQVFTVEMSIYVLNDAFVDVLLLDHLIYI